MIDESTKIGTLCQYIENNSFIVRYEGQGSEYDTFLGTIVESGLKGYLVGEQSHNWVRENFFVNNTKCDHHFVNVSAFFIKMVCKHCDAEMANIEE